MKTLATSIPEIKDERITLRRISRSDAPSLQELTDSPKVYRYLPTFLFEKKYSDVSYVIQHLYDECLEESLILGIYLNKKGCGEADMAGIEPDNEESSLPPQGSAGCMEAVRASIEPDNEEYSLPPQGSAGPGETDMADIEPDNEESSLPPQGNAGPGEEPFCGIIELYGYREPIHKISIGYRLLERFWGSGIATEAVGLLVNYLYTKTSIEIITASTMIENRASARVLMKNDFDLVVHAVPEDWGYETPTITDKWIR